MDSLKRKSSKPRSPTSDEKIVCEIILLDPSQPNYIITMNIQDNGRILFDNVCMKVGGILEKDYFGLRYLDRHGQRQWLELNKTISKQIKDKNHQKSAQTFSFRFKHYPKCPWEDLKQELSRYLLYLQLRRDLYRGRLIGDSAQQYKMAALILQAEIGEFEINDIGKTINISDLKILPRTNRKSEGKMLALHKTYKDLTEKEAEKLFLEEASKLETYGVEPIPVKDQKGNELFVGIAEDGISTFNGTKRAHTFPWQSIIKLSYSHKMFMFQVIMNQRKHILGFKCETSHAACALWKWALDRKYFFTLEKGSEARRSRSGGSLFRKKKVHTFSGMSQRELTQSCENLQIIPQPHVVRAQSMVTLMRSLSSRNESSNFYENSLPNGIDSIEKGYSTLPRSTALKYMYSDSNAQRNKNKTNSEKSMSSSIAASPVLDFMQGLVETPLIHRSPQNNFDSQFSDFFPQDSDRDDFNVCTEMIEIANQEMETMSNSDQALNVIRCSITNDKNKQSSSSSVTANPNCYFPFILISITVLLIIVIYGFRIIFHIHSNDDLNLRTSQHDETSSVLRWLLNAFGKMIFPGKKSEEIIT